MTESSHPCLTYGTEGEGERVPRRLGVGRCLRTPLLRYPLIIFCRKSVDLLTTVCALRRMMTNMRIFDVYKMTIDTLPVSMY